MGPEYGSHVNAEQNITTVEAFSDQGPGQSTLRMAFCSLPLHPVCAQWGHVRCGHGGWGGAYLWP